MPAKMKRFLVGVGRKHPVTTPKALLIDLSMRQVCALEHQTGAQYAVMEWTKARAGVRSAVASTPSLDPIDN